MLEIDEIRNNLERVLGDIEKMCKRAGRDPAEVTLISVTKTFSVEVLKRAILAGATDLGENYVQEAKEKIEEIILNEDKDGGENMGEGGDVGDKVRWHFIGRLQRNKAKYAVKLFDLIHTVDSVPLAVELDKRAGNMGKVQDILVQVNISFEEQKSGISVGGVIDLVGEISTFKNLKIQGLMGMPPFGLDPETARPFFVTLRGIREKVQAENIPNVLMTELSMGMSADYTVAIEEGATMVRVGTAIFGARG